MIFSWSLIVFHSLTYLNSTNFWKTVFLNYTWLKACPVFYLHFLEEILLKKSWKTGKVLRWLDKLNFTRSSSRNIFSWFAGFFFTKFPLEKKSVFSHTCSGGSPVMNIFLPPITDLFYNFSRRIFSRKTHIDRRLNLSDPPNKLSQFYRKSWQFARRLAEFNRRSICVFREKMRLEKL